MTPAGAPSNAAGTRAKPPLNCTSAVTSHSTRRRHTCIAVNGARACASSLSAASPLSPSPSASLSPASVRPASISASTSPLSPSPSASL
eukprot:CAMPEP_0170141136 /NCGR_PEP_ID=MMETSP0033_2-20121228/6810_1 /TAXON_ID=195969 /ORGANISM="Dolichomastix tenuilepis, Strain CCMP3274" /LENGTH=88 /DNA_ID=CAMNT_0010377385 /DNA_START=91 /DNA_END=353 /DNA_ORIENTATION=-